MDAEYIKEMEEREARRDIHHLKRLRAENRHRIALALFRDICTFERHRINDRVSATMGVVGEDRPQDFTSHATEAVEAADALLTALDNDTQGAIPHYMD